MAVKTTLGLLACMVVSVAGGCTLPNEDMHSQNPRPVLYSEIPMQGDSSGETRQSWQTKKLPTDYNYLAPDGSEVRLLVEGERASMAQFRLPVGHTSGAVAHHSVEEFWYVVRGSGQMWCKGEGENGDVIELVPGVSVVLPPGTHFQFRNTGSEALEIVGVTVPAWPGAEEAYSVKERWPVSTTGD